MITLTAWWRNFDQSLQELKQAFPHVYDKHIGWNTAHAMAYHGQQIEEASIFNLSSIANQIEKLSKKLGQTITDSAGHFHGIPQIHTPHDALFAIVYLGHLQSFQNIVSPHSLLQKGALGKPGIEKRKPFIAEICSRFKEKINTYLAIEKNFDAFKTTFAQFEKIYACEKTRFEIPSLIAMQKTNPIPLQTSPPTETLPPEEPNHPFETQVGACIHHLFADINMPSPKELGALADELKRIERILDKINAYEKLKQITEKPLSVSIQQDLLSNTATPSFDPSIKTLTLRLKTWLHQHSLAQKEEDSQVLIQIHHDIIEQLHKQLALLSSNEVHFQIDDLDTLTTSELEQIIEKVHLLRDILQMDKKITKYIVENGHPLIPSFLHKIFCAIYQCHHAFLKKYFLPETWKCTYEARKLRAFLAEVKTTLIEQSNVDTATLRKSYKDSLINTKTTIDNLAFSFFTTHHANKTRMKLSDLLDSECYSNR